MATRLSKDMPVSDVSAFVRTLTAELRKDPDAGTKLAQGILKEFKKASYAQPAMVAQDEAREQQLKEQFGKRVAQLRQSLELSGTELARRAGVSQSYVWQIEKGTRDPSLTSLRRIAKALGLRVGALLDLYDE